MLNNPRVHCAPSDIVVFMEATEQDGMYLSSIFLCVCENTSCQVGGMREIESNMVDMIITSSLYYNTSDYLCNHLYKLSAPVKAPVLTSVCAPAFKPTNTGCSVECTCILLK